MRRDLRRHRDAFLPLTAEAIAADPARFAGATPEGLAAVVVSSIEGCSMMVRRRVMFARALRRRCPICGGGPLFSRWVSMARACPRCGLVTNRGEDGYALGALWFNLLAAEAVNTTIWVTVAIRTWPDVPWSTLHWIGPLTALLMPLLFFPFSKTLFLAFDLCFRPPEAAGQVEARRSG